MHDRQIDAGHQRDPAHHVALREWLRVGRRWMQRPMDRVGGTDQQQRRPVWWRGRHHPVATLPEAPAWFTTATGWPSRDCNIDISHIICISNYMIVYA